MKTTIQILYDEILFDGVSSAEGVLQEFMFVTRLEPDLEKKYDHVVQ